MTWYALLAGSTLVTIWVSGKLWWALSRYAYRPVKASMNHDELPSVSVCIAARNEMHALAQNLECVLASDYKKLEILVLDDNSTDDTPRIIKSFAREGVRFIAGRPLPAGWLGRNHAYRTLADEASGDLVLYLDVDTLVDRTTISQLVVQLVANNKAMVSVLPRRDDGLRGSAIFGTLRYMWELVFAFSHTPPSSSALWMIRRDRLQSFDVALKDYGMSVRPEQHIAQALQSTKAYYYLIASRGLKLRFEKRWHSQAESAERLYVPIFGRSVGGVVCATIVFIPLLAPIVIFWLASPSDNAVLFLWSLGLIFSNIIAFSRYVAATHSGPGVYLRIVLWPYLIAQDAALYLFSAVRYLTKTVTWKGRPVLAQPSNTTHYELNE